MIAHTTAQTAMASALATIAMRQPSASASAGSVAAPSMPPNGSPTCLSPTTVARWRGGNHDIAAVVEAGFSRPYPTPATIISATRTPYVGAALAASSPVAMMAWPRTSVRAVPQRSASTPPKSDIVTGPM